MAMPVSGCLHLNNAAYSGTCRSIAHAVYGGSPPATVTLKTMSEYVGFTAPHAMTCFYGYPSTVTICNCMTMGVGGDELVGSYYLKCSCDDSTVCSIGIPRGGTSSYVAASVNQGNYYWDYSGVVIKIGSTCYFSNYCWSINGGFAVNSPCTTSVVGGDYTTVVVCCCTF
jgi:hypothetical protein